MKRIIGASAILLLGAGALALAQDGNAPQTKTHTESFVKHSGPGPSDKVKTEKVHGTVKEYEPGKKIKISGPDDKTYSFDLDENARVEGAVVVGQMADVSYRQEADGREHVSVISGASGEAMGAATMPRSHSETAVKHRVPGAADTKAKTETVVGVVKDFEPGKKIVVTGPDNKDYRFDLDENASMAGPVAVGDRVKVSYRKGDAGNQVTVVARYRGKA
jgi:hypothetical protein